MLLYSLFLILNFYSFLSAEYAVVRDNWKDVAIEIGEQPVPATFLMAALEINWLEIIFQIVVFGTFVETGSAMLHAVNERLEGTFAEQGRHLPQIARPIIAIGFLLAAVFAAELIGIVDLIAQGYGYITIAFIAVLVVPMLTIGVWKITRKESIYQISV